MSAAKADARWRRDAELPFQQLDEELIVVDPKSRQVHLFNETAARIWELLSAPRSLAELADTLAEEYDADDDELRTAISECLSGLSDKGLIAAVGEAR
jgi:PqqD family protein of HPr-rel-A system